MGRVFIAYSSQDMRLLAKLQDELGKRISHTIFVAKWDVPYGESWRKQIQSALDSADFFIPLLSRNFLQSEEAMRELQYAIKLADEKRLRVIPVLIEDLKSEEIPYHVSDKQYIPYKPFDARIDDLVRVLGEAVLSKPQDLIDYVNRKKLSSREMVDLAKQALEITLGHPTEWGRAAKAIADRLWNQGHQQEALEVYDILVKKFPQIDSIRISRAGYLRKLRHYQEADNECALLLQRDPKSVQALISRFWVMYEWMISTSSPEQQQLHIHSVKECLENLGNIEAASSPFFLPQYLNSLAKGAELCKDVLYADKALSLINNNEYTLKQVRKWEERKSILNSLGILERIYINLGEADKSDGLRTLKEQLEDLWQMYRY